MGFSHGASGFWSQGNWVLVMRQMGKGVLVKEIDFSH